MEVSVQRKSILEHPLGMLLVALGGAAVWVVFPGNRNLAFIVVAVLFIIGIRQPIWAVAALLVSQLSIPGFYVGPITLRLLMLLLTVILLWRAHVKEKIQIGKKAIWLIIPVIFLIAVMAISNLFNSSVDFLFKDFRYLLTGLLIVIVIPAVTKNTRDLRFLCGVVVITTTVSAIAALMQSFVHSTRVWGISEGPLQFSYIVGVVFLAVLGVLIVHVRERKNLRLLPPMLLMIPAVYLTYTRSALFALFFGLITLFFFLKTRIRGEIILLGVLVVTLFLSTSGIIDNFSLSARSEANQEASSYTRKILWQTGLAIAMDNPVLGIGGTKYMEVSVQYADSIDESLLKDRYWTYESLGLGWLQIHNDFLRMWVYYGIFALVGFLWIILVMVRNYVEAFRTSKRKFIKGLSAGLAAGLVAYSINAFYHNVLADFSLFWIIAGFSLAVIKLANQENNQLGYARNGMTDNA